MKVYALVLLLGLVGGYFVCFLTTNEPSVVTKYQDRVVTQDVVKTITKIVKEPGGVTTITKESTKVSDKKVDKVASHVSSPAKASSYRLGALFTPTFQPYALSAERRVLGPVWAGVQANKDREILFTLSWEL